MPLHIELGCRQHIRKQVVISINCESCPIQVVMEFVNYLLLEGQEFYLMYGVVSLCRAQLLACKCDLSQAFRVILEQNNTKPL